MPSGNAATPTRDEISAIVVKARQPDAFSLEDLIRIMAILRTPVIGCPWDLEQSFATIAPYTIEEAYEVADAIARGDLYDLKDELGDLLLQVIYHARLAQEQLAFDFSDTADHLARKLIRRHPHIFGDETALRAGEVRRMWDRIKAEEASAKAAAQGEQTAETPASALDGVPVGLPALTRSVKIQRKAAKVGFDWHEVSQILAKLNEEIAELRHEIDTGARAAIEEEFGDMLFVMANLARRLEIDPEHALRGANAKFMRRFAHIERRLAERGTTPGETSLAEMEALWQEAKTLERNA